MFADVPVRVGPVKLHQTWRATLLVLVMSLLVLVAGCTPQGAGGEQPAKTLVIGATAQPPTMDATSNNAAAVAQVMLYNVYETLVKMDSEGNLRPLLATRWNVSPDRTTYTFELEPKATFASGRAVTASDIVWNIERIKTAENTTATVKGQMGVVEKATATNEHTVEVTLKEPSNAWLYNMSSTAGMIVDPQANVDLNTATAGSGPYQLKQWNQGSSVVLQSNPHFWGTPARFDEVTFQYFSDANAMNAAMLSGQLDIISNVQAPQALDQFNDTARFTIVEGTTNGEVVMSFNHQTKALQDKRVRQAIHYAIDRRALVDTVWAGHGTLIGSMVPPTDPWYEDLSNTYPYDPAKAKQLLKDAGQQNLRLRLRVPALPYATASAQFVASQLKEVGINAVVDELEFPARWLDVVYTKGDYDMSIVAHVESRDIVQFANPKYYFHYNNKEFNRLIAEADRASADQYPVLMKQAAKILADDAAADWLFLLPNLVVTKAEVTGVAPNATSLSFDLTAIAKR